MIKIVEEPSSGGGTLGLTINAEKAEVLKLSRRKNHNVSGELQVEDIKLKVVENKNEHF